MSKQNIENRFIPFVSPLFDLNSESKLFFFPFDVFFGETFLLLI